jgi:hypothetical protein
MAYDAKFLRGDEAQEFRNFKDLRVTHAATAKNL